ncbi:MAG: proton-conducting transporter membrane subunit, partial [bacterium]
AMPITFATALVAGLSISGVPPFNGFFSKWMVYQGIVELGKLGGVGNLWILWLLVAMFGSALTMASFMKLIHATFLGTPAGSASEKASSSAQEVGLSMSVPMVILASLCVIFGIFAYQLPLRLFILASVPGIPSPEQWIGWWQPGLTTGLIIVGIIIGAIIYLSSKVKLFRESTSYIGGEEVSPKMKVSGVDFYDTVRNFSGLSKVYEAAEKKKLDFYDWGMVVCRGLAYVFQILDRAIDCVWRSFAYLAVLGGKGASLLHSGILHTYLAWYLVGLILLLLIFLL